MTTTEIIEAEELARWIDGELDTLPNEECSVALWVLRPDLAPNPKVTVEDVLAKVTSGPFLISKQKYVSGVDESIETDDFIDAIFAQSRTTVSSRASLQDVLDRVESGPFALKEEAESSEMKEVIITDSANNDRWWTRPWIAGGLAAVLVLFTLIPNQFKTPVSQDSIFTSSFEVEKALPAEEIEAEIMTPSNQQDSSKVTPSISDDFAELEPEATFQMRSRSEPPLVSPRKKSKARPVKELKSESAPLPSVKEQRQSTELVENVETGAVDKQFQAFGIVDDLGDFESPTSKAPSLNQLSKEEEGINSLDINLEVMQNTDNDLDGNTAEVYTYENTGEIQFEFLDNVNFDDMEEQKLSTPTALMMSVTGEGAATPPSDIEVIPTEEQELLTEYMEEEREEMVVSRSSLDSVVVEEVAKESFAVPRRKKERSSAGLLSKRQRTPMAEETPEDPMSVRAESVQDSNGLPLTLTQKQLLSVQQADGEQALLALCDINRPTQSLDILWLASQRCSNVEAISLLRYSSQYDHGDARYLKRNWLYLASLLRQTGQIEEAAKYEQLASSLP